MSWMHLTCLFCSSHMSLISFLKRGTPSASVAPVKDRSNCSTSWRVCVALLVVRRHRRASSSLLIALVTASANRNRRKASPDYIFTAPSSYIPDGCCTPSCTSSSLLAALSTSTLLGSHSNMQFESFPTHCCSHERGSA